MIRILNNTPLDYTLTDDTITQLREACHTSSLNIIDHFTRNQLRGYITDHSWALTPSELLEVDALIGVDDLNGVRDYTGYANDYADDDYACDGPGMCDICDGLDDLDE